MRCIAHRGFAETHPENTVTAVRAAADSADAVEIDVRRCASGELVAVNDQTVDRVTGASGRVTDYTAADLADMSVLGSGDGIPTLSAVIGTVPDGTELNLELKERGTAGDALAAADDAGVAVWVSSFTPAILREAREVGAERVAYLSSEDDGADVLTTALADGCTAVHPHWQLCVDDFVERAHDAGLAVNAWTVPSRHDAEALADVGVDGVIVDRPTVCVGEATKG